MSFKDLMEKLTDNKVIATYDGVPVDGVLENTERNRKIIKDLAESGAGNYAITRAFMFQDTGEERAYLTSFLGNIVANNGEHYFLERKYVAFTRFKENEETNETEEVLVGVLPQMKYEDIIDNNLTPNIGLAIGHMALNDFKFEVGKSQPLELDYYKGIFNKDGGVYWCMQNEIPCITGEDEFRLTEQNSGQMSFFKVDGDRIFDKTDKTM